MKLIKICILLLLIFTTVLTRKTKKQKIKTQTDDSSNLAVSTTAADSNIIQVNPKIFKNKYLISNPDRDSILTDEALKFIFEILAYKSEDTKICINSKFDLSSKKNLLSTIFIVSKKVQMDFNQSEFIKGLVKDCDAISSLTTDLLSNNFSSKIEAVRKQIVALRRKFK